MITRHAHYLMHWVTFGHFALVVIETETLLYIHCISVWHYGLVVWICSSAMKGTPRERNSGCRILPVMKKKGISLSNAAHIKQITTRVNLLNLFILINSCNYLYLQMFFLPIKQPSHAVSLHTHRLEVISVRTVFTILRLPYTLNYTCGITVAVIEYRCSLLTWRAVLLL